MKIFGEQRQQLIDGLRPCCENEKCEQLGGAWRGDVVCKLISTVAIVD